MTKHIVALSFTGTATLCCLLLALQSHSSFAAPAQINYEKSAAGQMTTMPSSMNATNLAQSVTTIKFEAPQASVGVQPTSVAATLKSQSLKDLKYSLRKSKSPSNRPRILEKSSTSSKGKGEKYLKKYAATTVTQPPTRTAMTADKLLLLSRFHPTTQAPSPSGSDISKGDIPVFTTNPPQDSAMFSASSSVDGRSEPTTNNNKISDISKSTTAFGNDSRAYVAPTTNAELLQSTSSATSVSVTAADGYRVTHSALTSLVSAIYPKSNVQHTPAVNFLTTDDHLLPRLTHNPSVLPITEIESRNIDEGNSKALVAPDFLDFTSSLPEFSHDDIESVPSIPRHVSCSSGNKQDCNKKEATITTTTATTTARGTKEATEVQQESISEEGKNSKDMIKLIDLEKYDSMKSIGLVDGLSTVRASSSSVDHIPSLPAAHGVPKKIDIGHDGVKITKKKQLLDKHFESGLGVSDDSGNFLFSSQPRTQEMETIKNAYSSTVSLVPIPNGYLGPIFMEEKSFSNGHYSTEKPHHHRSLIESQIGDGRLVEIIAPIEDVSVGSTTAAAAATTKNSHSPLLSSTTFQVKDDIGSHAKRQTSTTSELPILSTTNYDLSILGSHATTAAAETKKNVFKSENVPTNIKEMDGLKATVRTIKKPTVVVKERNYAERLDLSIQKSSRVPTSQASAVEAEKPEPAAIEIHINVSEGFGKESEDLEFSYRQPDNVKSTSRLHADFITLKPFDTIGSQNDSSAPAASSIEPDEILVVEIVDGDDNSTENSASRENPNPIFTFRSDGETEVELKDVKYFNDDAVVGHNRRKEVDDLFLPHLENDDMKHSSSHLPPATQKKPSTVDHDSDTIFYISNTEVKVGESLPTPNTYETLHMYQQKAKKTRQENKFAKGHHKFLVNSAEQKRNESKSEEEAKHWPEQQILVLPQEQKQNKDKLKIFHKATERVPPPLDVSYVGESIMEVEQSPLLLLAASSSSSPPPTTKTTTTTTTTSEPSMAIQSGNVIIQPVILPEMSIGVPVIGALPPQIELRAIDFIPDDENSKGIVDGGGGGGSGIETENDNDIDKTGESSIQYGGDLIDERGVIGGGEFDSYPFGNMASIHHQPSSSSSASSSSSSYFSFQSLANHGVNNLRKDELTADVIGFGETNVGVGSGNGSGFHLKQNNNSSMNESKTERMGNATAYSVMEEPASVEEFNFTDVQTLVVACIATLLPLILSVFMAFGLRLLYRKYQAHPINQSNSTHQLANEKSGNGSQAESPDNVVIEPEIIGNESNITVANISVAIAPFNSQNPMEYSNCLSGDNPSVICSSYPLCDPQPPPNGSVTKMTLKNNHLIVETEERNDISRDARETKMHYNTSEKDGVFVVEVSRGIDSKTMPSSPIGDDNNKRLLPIVDATQQHCNVLSAAAFIDLKENNAKQQQQLMNHEKVLIHQPPPELPPSSATMNIIANSNGNGTVADSGLHQIDEDDELNASPRSVVMSTSRAANGLENEINHQANTGLSQSDLSSSSSPDSNKRYSYGNQQIYSVENPGYGDPYAPVCKASATANIVSQQNDDDRKSEDSHIVEQLLPDDTPSSECENSQENCASQNDFNRNREINKEQDDNSNENLSNNNGVDSTEASHEEKNSDEIDALIDSFENTEVPLNSQKIDDNDQANLNLNLGASENGGSGYDSIISLPEPPTTAEMIEMTDSILIDSVNLDSLPPPPPPPPLLSNSNDDSNDSSAAETDRQNHLHQNGNNGYNEQIPPPSTQMTALRINSNVTPPSSPYAMSNGKKTTSSFQLHHHRPIPTIAVDVTSCS